MHLYKLELVYFNWNSKCVDLRTAKAHLIIWEKKYCAINVRIYILKLFSCKIFSFCVNSTMFLNFVKILLATISLSCSFEKNLK